MRDDVWVDDDSDSSNQQHLLIHTIALTTTATTVDFPHPEILDTTHGMVEED
jgi:hypothetical protein